MRKLLLLRHAKSSWEDNDLDDFERPLTKRGTKAAAEVGQYLAASNLKPDLVLCSSAVRTRATMALILPELGSPAPKTATEDALYLALAAAILDRVRKVKSDVQSVMVVGHNPGLHALALELTGTGARDTIAQLATGFPTAALALFSFGFESWTALAPTTGHLERFVVPRERS